MWTREPPGSVEPCQNVKEMEIIITWIVAVPAFLAELSLTYWLLFKGAETERRYNQAPAAI